MAMSSRHADGVHVDAKGKKSFCALENNPSVFSALAERLGVSSALGFYDVFSVNDKDLLSTLPRPVHALIFISPSDVYRRVRSREGATQEQQGHDGDSDIDYTAAPVMWFRQEIGNACGLYALIHSVANGSARQYVQSGSLLDRLLEQAAPLTTVPRAAVLYDSRELEEAHMACARSGDSTAPPADQVVPYHFISFARGTDGHLWELEGCTYPLDRGELGAGEDLLSERAIARTVRRYLDVAETRVDFSIVALATKP